jgi:hypothetical protein
MARAAHLGTLTDDAETVPQQLEHISDAFDSLNRSASRAKFTGHFYLAITLIIGFFILLLFVYSTEITSTLGEFRNPLYFRRFFR